MSAPWDFTLPKLADIEHTPRLDEQIMRQAAEHTFKTIEGAVGKPAATLTDEEKAAIAFYANVPLECYGKGGGVGMRTVPCVVQDNGAGGYIVAWRDDGMCKSVEIGVLGSTHGA